MSQHKLLAIALAASIPLAACTPPQSAGTVVTKVQLTALQTLTAIERGYVVLSKTGMALAAVGMIDKPKFKALDNEAYNIVLKTRTAYKTARGIYDYAAAFERMQTLSATLADMVE